MEQDAPRKRDNTKGRVWGNVDGYLWQQLTETTLDGETGRPREEEQKTLVCDVLSCGL